jgi:hypothetical protein
MDHFEIYYKKPGKNSQFEMIGNLSMKSSMKSVTLMQKAKQMLGLSGKGTFSDKGDTILWESPAGAIVKLLYKETI